VTRTRAITKAVKRPPRTSAEFDGHVGELRDALGRVDALADSLKRSFDQRHIGESAHDVIDRRTSFLIDLTAEAAARALDELNRAGDALGKRDVPDEDWGDA
jgi:chemotaxis regulatin CheY-phosphate phosphatase CheZ